jgi:hypothetical protein
VHRPHLNYILHKQDPNFTCFFIHQNGAQISQVKGSIVLSYHDSISSQWKVESSPASHLSQLRLN